jgi:N-methylhydantoinase A
MIAFGGGAPLHACSLAEKIGIRRIVVPKGAGVGSAIGFLRAPVAYEISKSAVVPLQAFDAARVNRLLEAMTGDARAVVSSTLGGKEPVIEIVADCRYIGQGHEIRVRVPQRRLADRDGETLKAEFERLYEQVYGLRIPNQDAEAITWSVTVSSKPRKPRRAAMVARVKSQKPRRRRTVYDARLGRLVEVPVYWRFDLKPGAAIKGPAIIAEDETSTIVGTYFRARIDSLGYILLERMP